MLIDLHNTITMLDVSSCAPSSSTFSGSQPQSQERTVSPVSTLAAGENRLDGGLNTGITGRRAHAAVRMHAVPTTGFWGYCPKPMADHSQRLRVAT